MIAARLLIALLAGALARPCGGFSGAGAFRTLAHETESALQVNYRRFLGSDRGRERDGTWLGKDAASSIRRAFGPTSLCAVPTTGALQDVIDCLERAMEQSYLRYAKNTDGASTGWTDWVDHPSKGELSDAVVAIAARPIGEVGSGGDGAAEDQDDRARNAAAAAAWLHWLMQSPSVTSVDLSGELRDLAGGGDPGESAEAAASRGRYTLMLHVLPPGQSVACRDPAGSVVLLRALEGSAEARKLIKGVGDSLRVAGVTALEDAVSTTYGGPWRSLQATSAAAALVLELVLLPPNYEGSLCPWDRPSTYEGPYERARLEAPSSAMHAFCSREERHEALEALRAKAPPPPLLSAPPVPRGDAAAGPEARGLAALREGVGGMDEALVEIQRRILAPRRLSAGAREALGLRPIKGLLLSGPPGCGKTALARRLGAAVGAKTVSVVDGPELLSKWTGESERRVRELFAAAEGDAESARDEHLHLIVFDEIDAIAPVRGSKQDGGARDGVVNTLLAKMDGIAELDNVLVVGLTNRADILDPALLRPGRFEVRLNIGLPSADGRKEILDIHTRGLRERGAIDPEALRALEEFVVSTEPRRWRPQRRRRALSGAEIAGVVRNAAAFALERALDDADDGEDGELDFRVSADDAGAAIGAWRA